MLTMRIVLNNKLGHLLQVKLLSFSYFSSEFTIHSDHNKPSYPFSHLTGYREFSTYPPLHELFLIHLEIESDKCDSLKYPLSTSICSPPKHTAFSTQAFHCVLLYPSEYVPGEHTTHLSSCSISPDFQYLNEAVIVS